MRSIQHFTPFLELELGRAPDYVAAENIIRMHFFRDFAVIYITDYLLLFLLFFNECLQTRLSHCIGGKATHKSLKSLAIVTAKNEADNRVNSTVCVSHKGGDPTV